MDAHEALGRPEALVVYESMFGNTEAVAYAIADGLGAHMAVTVGPTTDAPSLSSTLRLLVVGGPTHSFSMSRATTRQDAGSKGGRPRDAAGIGLREWLDALVVPSEVIAAATFDTKIRRPRLPGSAAGAARRRLRRMGMSSIDEPEHFYVGGTAGPLLDGELDRARGWGGQLGAGCGAPSADWWQRRPPGEMTTVVERGSVT